MTCLKLCYSDISTFYNKLEGIEALKHPPRMVLPPS